MKIVTTPQELQDRCTTWKRDGLTVGVVPTMGYLHDGHVALMDRMRPECDRMVVTVFVNPTQFGANEDLSSYPHDLEGDCAKAKAHGADLVFAPAPDAMYADDHATWVEVPKLGERLCGASRPIHFRGVCTVVCKLFNLTRADKAVFGEKDWQQLAILRRMVRDLNMPVELLAQPIVREEDGLALSSRNAYLTEAERALAPGIRRGLLALRDKVAAGLRDAALARKALADDYAAALPPGEVDYIEIVDPVDIVPVDRLDKPALVAVAVRLGKARLIDNLLIEV